MTDNSTYDSSRTANVASLPMNDFVGTDLLGLLSIISILILLLSEGNILLGIIS
jgi:hypothetical protein